MRRGGRRLAIAAGLILLAVVVWRLVGTSPTPGGISAAALTPAPTPADARQIAVLRLKVTSNAAGDVIAIALVEGDVRPGYAPNVLNRPGPWSVSLVSPEGEVLRYGVPDPRAIRIESDIPGQTHATEIESEIEFPLVVPLNDPLGGDLEVLGLRLFDQAGNAIFAAGVRDGKIVPVPVRQLPIGAAG